MNIRKLYCIHCRADCAKCKHLQKQINSVYIRRKAASNFSKREIKKLITWSKKQSESLQRQAQKSKGINLSNIYFARSEWIDYDLLPKLEAILKVMGNV